MADAKIRFYTVVMDRDHMNPCENSAVSIDIYLSNSLEQLKKKVEEKLNFLSKCQIWIINNTSPLDESRIISTGIIDCDTVDEGYVVYLYLAFDDEIDTKEKYQELKNRIVLHLLEKYHQFKDVTHVNNYLIQLDLPNDYTEWVCAKCTFKNSADNFQCNMCLSDR